MSEQIPSDNRHSNDLPTPWGCIGFGLLVVVGIVIAAVSQMKAPWGRPDHDTAAKQVAELEKLATRPKEFGPAYQAAKEAARQFPELQRDLERQKKGYAQALLRATVEAGLPAEPREATSQLKTLERTLEELDPSRTYQESPEWAAAEKQIVAPRVRQFQQQIEELVREKKEEDLVTLRGKIAREREEWKGRGREEARESLLLQIDTALLTPQLDQARELSRKGEHVAAIALLKKLEQEFPKNPHPELKKLFLEVCSAVLKNRLEPLRQEPRTLEKAKKPAELEKLLERVVSVWDQGKERVWDGGQWLEKRGLIRILGEDLEPPLFNELLKECATAIGKLETEEIQELLRRKELVKAYDRSKQAQGERTIFSIKDFRPQHDQIFRPQESFASSLRDNYRKLQGQAVALRLESARKDFVALEAKDDYAGIAALLRDLDTNWLSRPAPGEKAQNEFAAFRNSCRFWLKVAENAGKVKLP
jgi:hypothetical protein